MTSYLIFGGLNQTNEKRSFYINEEKYPQNKPEKYQFSDTFFCSVLYSLNTIYLFRKYITNAFSIIVINFAGFNFQPSSNKSFNNKYCRTNPRICTEMVEKIRLVMWFFTLNTKALHKKNEIITPIV